MTNIEFARAVLNRLFDAGVDEVVVCPGARNAAFVELLAHLSNIKVHSFFEERSAAFFALGRIAHSGRPKAVIVTSGTAVANLLPAMIEAHYNGAPLIAVTADRPRAYRGSGSPQTIIQTGMFSHYAKTIDLDEPNRLDFSISSLGPTHINVCFDEPLIDQSVGSWTAPFLEPKPAKTELKHDPHALADFQKQVQRPLIIVGGLLEHSREFVLEWLRRQESPLYIEAPSGLRAHPALRHLELKAFDKTLKSDFFDGLIRIGHVPTARVWRDMEKSARPVLSFSELPFPGLARPDSSVLALTSLAEQVLQYPNLTRVMEQDESNWTRLQNLLSDYPKSEPALVKCFSEQVGETDQVYLGNSLPIREWDLAASREINVRKVFANRGVNGIDGQLSTFFGAADPESRNWALVGDLTALYDLSSPWALRGRRLNHFTIGIVNNGGGRIFAPMFQQPLFENIHELSFSKWAAMWNLEYAAWDSGPLPAASVLEIRPDNKQTEAVKVKW